MSTFRGRPRLAFYRVSLDSDVVGASNNKLRFIQATIDSVSLSVNAILVSAFPVSRFTDILPESLINSLVDSGAIPPNAQPIIGLPVYIPGSSRSPQHVAGLLIDTATNNIDGLLLAGSRGNLGKRALAWQSIARISSNALYTKPHPHYIGSLGNRYVDSTIDIDHLAPIAPVVQLNEETSRHATEYHLDQRDFPHLEQIRYRADAFLFGANSLSKLDSAAGFLLDPEDKLSGGVTPSQNTTPNDPEHIPDSDTQGTTRYLNAWFRGHHDTNEPLALFRSYTLCLEVHPLLRVGNVIENDVRFREPETVREEFVDVVVGLVPDGFDIIGDTTVSLKLPIDKRRASPVVTFTVKPTMNQRDIHLDVLFYQQNNLFHAARITTRALPTNSVQTDESSFVETSPLITGAITGARDVNIFITQEADKFRFVVFHDDGKRSGIDWCTIDGSLDWLSSQLVGVREALLAAVYTGSKPNISKNAVYFAPLENDEQPAREEQRLAKMQQPSEEVYQKSLANLARAGRRLYSVLFDNVVRGDASNRERAQRMGQLLRELSRSGSLRIQVRSEDFIIPWNILYDGDYPSDQIDETAFWGFRHIIEEIPSIPGQEGFVSPIASSNSNNSETISIGMNLIDDATLAPLVSAQIKTVQTLGATAVRQNESAILALLSGKEPAMSIEYFYCHAKTGGDTDHDYDRSYLILSNQTPDTHLTLDEITLATGSTKALADTQPFLILNACESAEFDGRFYSGFVPWFLAQGARAVLGTDCDVPALFAAHFGEALLTSLSQGVSVGETLLSERNKFRTTHRNPLGLIYRVFGNTDLRC